MTVDEPASDPDLSGKAQAVIAEGLAQEDRITREAEQAELVNKILVPDDVLDRLITLWITARRRDEGMTRPIKADHLAHQKKMARMNQPVMALLRAAYRAGIYDTLYRSTDQEES